MYRKRVGANRTKAVAPMVMGYIAYGKRSIELSESARYRRSKSRMLFILEKIRCPVEKLALVAGCKQSIIVSA